MKEYIDREKAIEEIRLTFCKDCNSYNGVMCRACNFDDAMSYIEDVPTADVVEVVRCKDCKYWENGKDYEPYCNHIEGTFSDTTEDDFCSHGERKEQK